MTSGRGKEELA